MKGLGKKRSFRGEKQEMIRITVITMRWGNIICGRFKEEEQEENERDQDKMRQYHKGSRKKRTCRGRKRDGKNSETG